MINKIFLAVILAFSITTSFSQEVKSKKKRKIETSTAPQEQKDSGKIEITPAENRKTTVASVPADRSREKQSIDRDIAKISKPIVTQQVNGQIDWTNQYIEAKGEAVIDNERFKNAGQARAMATRGATVVAQRNLLEIINGVYVVGETTVQDMMTVSDIIQTRVEGVLKGAQLIGEPVEKNGMIEVTMRVPLYESNGLAAAVHDQLSVVSRETAATSTSQAEPVFVSSNIETKNTPTEEIENIVFNLTGKKYDPAMFPVVTDEKGNILLDLSKYYDPKKGAFPKIMETSKEILELAKIKKGTEIIDVIQSHSGKFVVPEQVASKVNWKKIGASAAKIGSFLLMLI
jgi:hypothetical protein